MSKDSVEYNLFTRFMFKNQPGIGQMRQTGGAFKSLHKNAKLAQAGVRQVGTGMRQFAMFGAGAIAVLGSLVKRGVDFDRAWHGVKRVVQGLPKDIQKLKVYAQRLGATTLFTATEAAQGMEQLARSSMDAKQVFNAIHPVLQLATADEVNLAAASGIVASSVNMFAKEQLKANKAVDAFAYISRNTMTNTTELGEALKYAGPAANQAGQSFHQMMKILGMLAQAGIKGSLAGTAYKNVIMKLVKGGTVANKIFGSKAGFNKAIVDSNNKLKPASEMLRLVTARLTKIKNPAERAALSFQLFGLRGVTAASAFAMASDNLKNKLTGIEQKAVGTAKSMAEITKASVHGQWTLLKSAVDGVGQSIFEIIKPTAAAGLKQASSTLTAVAGALKMVHEGAGRGKIIAKYGKTVTDVAEGIVEGFKEVGKTLKTVGKTIFGVFSKISGGGKNSTKKVTKLITKFVLLAAAITPVIAVVGALGLAFGGMFNIVSGGLKVVRALTSGWGLALTALVYVLAGGKKEGESFVSTMTRGLKRLAGLATSLAAPFMWMQKNLGTIPALIAGVAAYKGAKGIMSRIGSRVGGKKGVGGIVGSATGTPVFVTNWPTKLGMGGDPIGGGGKQAWWKRAGKWLFGAGAAGATSKFGIILGAAKTAGVALGGFALALAPAYAGIKALGDAYDPKKQKELRDKLMKQHYAAQAKETKQLTKKGILDEFGFRRDMDFTGNKRWDKLQRVKKWGGNIEGGRQIGTGYREAYGRGKGHEYSATTWLPFLKQMATVAKAGRAGFASQEIQRSGTADWTQQLLGSAVNRKYMMEKGGLTEEHIAILKDLKGLAERQAKGLEAGKKVYVSIDGKQIAVATAHTRLDSQERAGQMTAPGARRRATERGR